MKKGPGFSLVELFLIIAFIIVMFIFFSKVSKYSDENVKYGESVFSTYMKGSLAKENN